MKRDDHSYVLILFPALFALFALLAILFQDTERDCQAPGAHCDFYHR